MDDVTKCPFSGGGRAPSNRDWWPSQLDLSVLHQNSNLSDPMGGAFDYAKEFKSLDLNALIKDLIEHYSKLPFGNSNVNSDLLGDAYE